MSLAYFSVANINQFQYLMYRPLYWFGTGGTTHARTPRCRWPRSPVYSNNNTTVVVKLKPYKWSNGETVTAQDVMFWMNMMHSDKTNWAAYAPEFIPDNIKSITVDSPTQLTFTLNAPVNPDWFTYNQLSQITPLPVAWDITATGAAAGSGGCSTARLRHRRHEVQRRLHLPVEGGRATTPPTRTPPTTRLATYATNPALAGRRRALEAVVVRRLGKRQLRPATRATPAPPSPRSSKFVEVPFATDDDEYNALVGGPHLPSGTCPCRT